MMLTRDFKQAVVERVQRDPAFAKALLDAAATLLPSSGPDTARLILRDRVNATVGFEPLAQLTRKPSMHNLAAIFDAIRGWLKVSFHVRVVEAA
ncbi:MAG: transcriptional regulator [Hydrogenophaga sp.]|uniref:transcriptional regulator n=1 Tax=Hydrogenophaga sp. TaxID=1904254 RepID=UPI00271FB2F3|nr:transcriptional regulator [Hydrogenophaga sp.]MDO9146754.1 transcriptional regulator [Hydrogenophaga sp.]MDO9603461.1 transcriptional regulator [Hydrogenophaga sp.]